MKDPENPPLWSVMIPAYNPRREHLEQALRSVLAEDSEPQRMQIEVVDDCSPNVDVAALVKEIAGERVAYSRNEANLGLAGSWNRCGERSKGVWVHILHQDDYVLPGFYERLEAAAAAHPEVSLLTARCVLVDERGASRGETERLAGLESGGREVSEYLYRNPFRCPGVVVRRAFYESHGGFRTDLSFTLDWELWIRAIALEGGVALPAVLAAYRSSDENASARLAEDADTLQDRMRLNAIFAERYPKFDRKKAERYVCLEALSEADRFARLGQKRAAAAHLEYFRSYAPIRLRVREWVARAVRKLVSIGHAR